MVTLENVSASFGEVIALQPTSLNFERGEFTVLLGSSGAGKSTLLRCLNFLNRPTSGMVSIDGGRDLRDVKVLHQHRRRTGMIFQQHQLIGRHSALQNVLLGRIGYHSALRSIFPFPRKERMLAMEALERVGLLDKALERVDRLSGGQQQRVGIARALAQKPTLMLADEPVASLDPSSSHKILSLLDKICKEDGIPTVVSLHQVELAETYGDRIVGLAHGRVVFDGPPEQLTEHVLSKIYDSPSALPATEAPKEYPLIHDLVFIED